MSFLKNNIENENVLLILASNRAVDTYSLISMTPYKKDNYYPSLELCLFNV